jgi:dCTP deaminase
MSIQVNDFYGVLSDQQILNEMKNKNIWIYPFEHKNLSNSSYDVTIGPNYFRASKSPPKVLLPWVEESIEEYWGTPQYAETISTEYSSEYYKLPIGTKIILLEPGELILAHTNEFIGGTNNICSMMKCRSSIGRIGISVCKDAAFGNIGYINRWTMEISNFSQSTIPLVVGSRVAQIVFFYAGEVRNSYEKNGSYQGEYKTIEDLVEQWSTYDMLPKLKL